LSFVGKFMELENFILSVVREVQRAKGHVSSPMWNIDPIEMQAMLWKAGHAKERSLAREGG
jgi:hypothetical protein